MHQPTPPTAAELGISDAEYERILGDVQRRLSGEAPPPVPAPRRASRRWGLAALAVAVTVGLALLRSAAGADAEPAYAFMDTQDGRPVTYSSCGLLQVAVYPAGGPPDAEQLVREAVAQMRSATGLDIVVIGSFGGHAPGWNFQAAPIHPDDPISVSWQDGAAIARMTDDVAGLGGSPVVDNAYGGRQRVAGTIALSRSVYRGLEERGEHDQALAILLHEFGHVLGLDHVSSPGELMYEDNIGRTTLGPGDLEGLRLLGQGPCL
jgi:hypothetical protein